MSLLATTANNGGGWVELIVALSIFVPVVIATVLCVIFFRNMKNDPDAQRLRRAQQDYERTHHDGTT